MTYSVIVVGRKQWLKCNVSGRVHAVLLLKRIVNRCGRGFGINPFPRSFPNPLGQENLPANRIFDLIYERNFWGSTESRSGVGSEQGFVDQYRKRLAGLLKDKELTTVFDAPCGDLNWVLPLISGSNISYVGGDISPRVIEEARSRCSGVDLRVFDITTDPFPDADVWHCRDCLFHLPFAEIRRAFSNFSSSRIPYALLTIHRSFLFHKNLDVNVGGFRYLDLCRPPVSLPPAMTYLKDFVPGRDFPRYVGLWRRETISDALERWAP